MYEACVCYFLLSHWLRVMSRTEFFFVDLRCYQKRALILRIFFYRRRPFAAVKVVIWGVRGLDISCLFECGPETACRHAGKSQVGFVARMDKDRSLLKPSYAMEKLATNRFADKAMEDQNMFEACMC